MACTNLVQIRLKQSINVSIIIKMVQETPWKLRPKLGLSTSPHLSIAFPQAIILPHKINKKTRSSKRKIEIHEITCFIQE